MSRRALPRDARLLVGAFVASGVTHLVRPQTFDSMMPSWVPRHHELIYASGVLELLFAAGIVNPSTRRVAGWASAALLVGVFPANIQMTQDALATDSALFKALTIGRLPLQVPAVRAALRAARA